MSVDLGDVVPLSISIYDSDGALANATTVVLTVTLPDQTTATPSVTNVSPGIYEAAYATAQAGRHGVRWLATGTNAGAFSDVFDVRPASLAMIVSLADAKANLNIPADDTSRDEELRGFVEAATGVIERYVGAVVRTTHTEDYDGGGTAIALDHPPVLAITQVTEGGGVLAASDYKVDGPSGVLMRQLGDERYTWQPGSRNISVQYVAGMAIIPAHYTLAAKIIIRHMWETTRNSGGSRPALVETDLVDASSSYAIPYRALELLGEPVLGIA